MLYRTLTFILFLAVTTVHISIAQSDVEGVVSGSVTDGDTQETITSATVELRSASDSTLVTGAITRSDGTFELDGVDAGDYYLRISFVGYVTQLVPDVTISSEQQEIDVGEIALQTDTSQLDEVEVSAEREYMEVGVDKNVYNVENQPVTAGGSARDVLENIPSVEADIDGNISLRGSENVSIYLDGKPAPMSGQALTSFLEGLSSEDIERVEVIPNPSASYEPEGTSGIINIVLAKERDRGWGGGVNGSVSTRGRYSGSLNAHYGSGPWNLYSNYSMRYGQWDSNARRFRENRYLDPLTFLEQEMSGERGGFSHNVNTNIDYDFNNSNRLSLRAMLSHRDRNSDRLNRYNELDADRDVTNRYTRTTDGGETDFSMEYRLTYQHIVEPREHELTVEAQYEQDQQDELEAFTQRTLPIDAPDADGEITDRQRVDEQEDEGELALEVDYQRPLGENAYLEAGYDGERETVDNTFFSESLTEAGDFAPDTNLNNTFTYAEQTHSGYGILGGEMGSFGAQLGVRLERALTTFDLHTTNESFNNNYFSVFPSAHLSYELSQGNTFKVSYSKRVRRPSEWQLNPYGDYGDPTSRRVGNPYLTPEYTHSGEVSYSRLGEHYTLTFSPYYRYTVDEISWHEEITDDGVTLLTFENFDTEESYGAEVIGSLTLGEWLKGNASLNAYKRSTQAGNLSSQLSNDALGFRTRLSARAEVRPGLNLQISQSYRSPMDIPGGRMDADFRTNIALQQELFDGRGSLSLRARDVFGSDAFQIQRDMERYYQEYYRERQTRSVRLSFRYTFGQRNDERRRDQGGGGEGPGEGEGGGYGGM